MNRFSFHRPVALALLLGTIVGCSPDPEAGSAKQRYEVRGVVQGLSAGNDEVTIEHEAIPGFMPAMTMPFTVRNRDELRGFKVGDGIAFRFIVTERDAWITHLRPADASALDLPGREPVAATGNRVPRLREGDRLPDFRLTDQNNRPLTREDLAGKSTLLTFIFARCPLPNFCPLMQQNFAEVQKRLAGDAARERVRLLSISFDPEDTPGQLTRYADHYGADPALWLHAGGATDQTGTLTKAFSVYIQAEGGSYTHGLCTALVRPDGTIARIWRGNAWEVDEVIDAIHQLESPALAAGSTAPGLDPDQNNSPGPVEE